MTFLLVWVLNNNHHKTTGWKSSELQQINRNTNKQPINKCELNQLVITRKILNKGGL